MSGPIKHNTTGLWVEEGREKRKKGEKKTKQKKQRHPAQRAEKKSELVMNIHVAGGLNDCCFTGLQSGGKIVRKKRKAAEKGKL